MPKIIEWRGYKFFFFSNEGSPLEPCHIHVRKGASIAKFWIEPEITLHSSYEMTSKELAQIRKVIEKNNKLIWRKWNEFFSQ